MSYNVTLKDDVSLSKVLDAMICDNDSPEIIISFLEKNENEIVQIFRESLFARRIFQLDFFFRCKEHEISWIIAHLKQIPLNVAAYFVWQICKTESQIADAAKYKIRKNVEWIYEFKQSRHPYSSFDGKQASLFDQRLFQAAKENSIAETCALMSADKFSSIVKFFYKSLFRERLFQLDVFASLDEIKQWHMLNALRYMPLASKTKFQLQILDSAMSNDVKSKTLESMKITDIGELLRVIVTGNSELSRIITTSKTFDEFYMRLMLFGENSIQMNLIILYLLSNLNTKNTRSMCLTILKDWCKFDREGLDAILNVSNFIEALK